MEQVNLYIHIPFCVRKCLYCDFLSYPADEREKGQYVDLLCREIAHRGQAFAHCTVPGVFIGGGTPSCLRGEDVARIMETVQEVFVLERQAEVTIEMNPGTVDREKLRCYRSAGINRLSIGLQSSDNEMLRRLGRIHTYEAFLDCYELARSEGFGNISVDVMAALPGQTKEDLADTLHIVAKLSPEHISCYGLILEEGTPLYDRRESMSFPDEEEDREMYYLTKEILGQYGYRRYEISNYARPGMESRHNIGYWKRHPYLGLGLGASSFTVGCRYKNPSEPALYREMILAETYDARREEVHMLSREESMEEFMFLGLRMMQGIDREEFGTLFGESYEQVYGETTRRLLGDGLLGEDGSRLFLTDRGIDISNYVFARFLF